MTKKLSYLGNRTTRLLVWVDPVTPPRLLYGESQCSRGKKITAVSENVGMLSMPGTLISNLVKSRRQSRQV
ncbi:hypothetical protein PAAG_12295 [Paracoccidioides lutzii Pb01]|uniref:Uncharacterized protein n=1 Tax=Paracoccidioides lutzii (strain ATCC MYA-826 / Pb01) TaxID=502779 RepID=A0A0A2VJH1_PARBA|nr:hypothetical protein PAAG_12295 [Paracoccidioides lutzii Pb01]KGQ01044.1 hypothetical protein PAAG_12295 [Paracoccidioides lutzii Pb01]